MRYIWVGRDNSGFTVKGLVYAVILVLKISERFLFVGEKSQFLTIFIVSMNVHNNCFYAIDCTGSNNIEANSSHFLLQFAQNNSETSVSSDCGEKFCKALWETLGDDGGGHWLVQMESCPAGWSVCLPLLIFPCTMKSRSSLLAPAHPGGPGKRAVKRLCVWLHIWPKILHISD